MVLPAATVPLDAYFWDKHCPRVMTLSVCQGWPVALGMRPLPPIRRFIFQGWAVNTFVHGVMLGERPGCHGIRDEPLAYVHPPTRSENGRRHGAFRPAGKCPAASVAGAQASPASAASPRRRRFMDMERTPVPDGVALPARPITGARAPAFKRRLSISFPVPALAKACPISRFRII
jgi:hypothetical protein